MLVGDFYYSSRSECGCKRHKHTQKDSKYMSALPENALPASSATFTGKGFHSHTHTEGASLHTLTI